MRKSLVAGNWKMNTLLDSAQELARGVHAAVGAQNDVDVAVCPPSAFLHPVAQVLSESKVGVGAQDVYFEGKGAFTGELSVEMLASVGCKCVIIGHSERRHTIGHLEDDRMINLKVRATLAGGLTPILCIGETLGEREAEQTFDVLTYQLQAGLVSVEISDPAKLVIAYEPVWAIGTGRTATPDQAQEAHAHVRSELKQRFGAHSDGIRVLYGGSCKPDNAKELFSLPDVDGGLIGGASLKPDSFAAIVEAGAK